MLRRLREAGPALLVPLAWFSVALAERGILSARAILVAHVVMTAFIGFFLATGAAEMETGALAGWRAIIAAGFVVTLGGLSGFFLPAVSTPLWLVSLVGWMALPIPGFLYTAWLLGDDTGAHRGDTSASSGAWIYTVSAAVSTLGLAVSVVALAGTDGTLTLVGVGLVGVGHTIGIVDAVVRF